MIVYGATFLLCSPGATWQEPPTWAIVVGVPLVPFVGWPLPMLGVCLLVFLVVALVVGAVRQHRVVRIAPTSPIPIDAREPAAKA